MSDILFIVGDVAVTTGAALMAFAGLVLALLIAIAIVLCARRRSRSEAATMAQAIRADELEERFADMLRAQAETSRPHAGDGRSARGPPGRRWRAC